MLTGLPLSPLLEVSDRIIEATASEGTQHTLDVVHSVSTGRGSAHASHSRTGALPLAERQRTTMRDAQVWKAEVGGGVYVDGWIDVWME